MKKREIFVKEKLDVVFDEIGVVKKVEKNTYKKSDLLLPSIMQITKAI